MGDGDEGQGSATGAGHGPVYAPPARSMHRGKPQVCGRGGGEHVVHADALSPALTGGSTGLQCEQPICTPPPKGRTAAGCEGVMRVGGRSRQDAPHRARPGPCAASPAQHHPSRAPRVAAAARALPRAPRAPWRQSARRVRGRQRRRTAVTNGGGRVEPPPSPSFPRASVTSPGIQCRHRRAGGVSSQQAGRGKRGQKAPTRLSRRLPTARPRRGRARARPGAGTQGQSGRCACERAAGRP